VSQLASHSAERRRITVSVGPLALLDAPALGPTPRRPVLLVPGYTGSKEDFAPLMAGIAAAGHRAVALDLPGQHESSGPAEVAAYSVEALARTVLEVADLLGDSPLHLLGHSFGGLIARAAVLAEPARVQSLTLLGSGPAALDGPRVDRMHALRPVLAAGGMAAVHQALEAEDPRTAGMAPELRAFLRRRFVTSTPAGLTGMGEALLAEPDRVAELRATGVPVLVVYGEYDDAWSPAVQADMAERLGARHEVVPGAVHSPAVEAPGRTLEVLTRFWRDAETPPVAGDGAA